MNPGTFVHARYRHSVILAVLFGLMVGCASATGPLAVSPLLPGVGWHNVEEIEATEHDGFRLSRVPREVRERLNPAARLRAYSPTGAELRFNLNGERTTIVLKYVEDRAPRTRGAPVLAEVWWGDYLLRTVALQQTWTEIEIKKPANFALIEQAAANPSRRYAPDLVRVALPHGTEVRVQRVTGDISSPRPEQLPARRYLAYGSSITHGYDGVRPGDSYPARVAQRLGVEPINLGFGAGAHLEAEMADWIARRHDWDFASFELGVNMLSRFEADEFRRRVRYFLSTVAAAHPEKWIFVIDIFGSFRDLAADPRQAAFREVVAEEARRLGSARVVHVDARSLLGPHGALGADLLHPSPDGFEEIAAQLSMRMRDAMAPSP
jgi:lysophospholipase L1-like esterase